MGEESKSIVNKGDQFVAIVVSSFKERFLYCYVIDYDSETQMVKFSGFNDQMNNRREVKIVHIKDLVFTESVKSPDKREIMDSPNAASEEDHFSGACGGCGEQESWANAASSEIPSPSCGMPEKESTEGKSDEILDNFLDGKIDKKEMANLIKKQNGQD